MPAEIRHLEPADVDPWIRAVRLGFLQGITDAMVEARRPDIDVDRAFGAFDGGRVVGTLRSQPTDLVVPGGARLATAALTNVTVSPSHRRQGLLTQMITQDLKDSRDRGEVLGALVAAEYPIYGRYGYGPACPAADLLIESSATFRPPRDAGRVDLIEPADARHLFPGIYEQARTAWPGAIARRDRWWDEELGLSPNPNRPEKDARFLAVSRNPDGVPDGFVHYTTEDKWDRNRPMGILTVEDLIGVDDTALARLWRYCLEVDWIVQVRADNRSIDELLPWLLVDARLAFEESRGDLEWVRLIDTAAALAGRTYLCDGTITLEIVDPLGLASGRYHLEGGPDGATCRPTSGSADLVVAVDVLGTAYLGGISLAMVARGGGVEECTPGALARADAMFRGVVAPWCATGF